MFRIPVLIPVCNLVTLCCSMNAEISLFGNFTLARKRDNGFYSSLMNARAYFCGKACPGSHTHKEPVQGISLVAARPRGGWYQGCRRPFHRYTTLTSLIVEVRLLREEGRERLFGEFHQRHALLLLKEMGNLPVEFPGICLNAGPWFLLTGHYTGDRCDISSNFCVYGAQASLPPPRRHLAATQATADPAEGQIPLPYRRPTTGMMCGDLRCDPADQRGEPG